MKKTIKFLLLNLFVMTVTSLCYGQADFFTVVKQYMDTGVLATYNKAYAANEADAGGMPESGFLIEYTSQHPEFSKAIDDATKKAMTDLGITDPKDLVKASTDSIEKLKAEIDANQKLLDDQKEQMKAQLEQYQNALAQMQQQLADTQNAAGGGGGGGSTPPQMSDIMGMLMGLLQKIMGGGGGK